MGEGDQEVQSPSYKITKSWIYYVQHGDKSQQYFIAKLKVA